MSFVICSVLDIYQRIN